MAKKLITQKIQMIFWFLILPYRINPAEIESVEANSIAQEIGFESGDSIISINGKKPEI